MLNLEAFGAGEPVSITFRNLIGQSVSEFGAQGGSNIELSVADLSPGLYVVRVSGSTASVEVRLIKR